jgi:hypothetical protein
MVETCAGILCALVCLCASGLHQVGFCRVSANCAL